MGFWSNLFSNVIGRKKRDNPSDRQYLGGSVSGQYINLTDFLSGNGKRSDPKANAIYCNCVRRLVNSFAMSRLALTYKGREVTDGDFTLREMISLRPNPHMSFYSFMRVVGNSYFGETLSTVYIDRNEFNDPIGLYPIDTGSIQYSYSNGLLWLTFPNKGINLQGVNRHEAMITVPELDMLILPFNPTVANPFGEADYSLARNLRVIERNFDGFEEAIKTSHLIRYILTKPGVDSDDEEIRADFDRQIRQDKSGLIILNHSEKLEAINTTPVYAKQPEIENFEQDVYAYFNVNRNICQSNLTDMQHHYYIQLAIAPFIKQLVDEMNIKLLTRGQRAHGNAIVCDTDPIDTASLDTRKSVAQLLISSGYYIPNEIRKILKIAPLDDKRADELVQSLNFNSVSNAKSAAEVEQSEKSKEGQKVQETNQAIDKSQEEN